MKTHIHVLHLTAALALAAALPICAMAATLRVPEDYPTIQAAVDAAAPAGDEILIASGVYTQQVFIAAKKLTLTGSPGTILQAWTGMTDLPPYPIYALLDARGDADVVVRNIEFDGKRLAQIMPNADNFLAGVNFVGGGGCVENCVIRGFRGTTRLVSGTPNSYGGTGYGLTMANPSSEGTAIKHVQVLNNAFSDNARSIFLIGEPPGFGDMSLLRTTFTVHGNTITGVGPTGIDYQLGIAIRGGASGLITRNRIVDHYRTTDGVWSRGIAASEQPLPLQPLRIEGNTFVRNQKHAILVLADNSTIINNTFEGSGPTFPCDGLILTGANILTSINRFTNIVNGVLLAANYWHLGGAQAGVASDPLVLANQFCDVFTPLSKQVGVVNPAEVGTEACPFPPAGFGELTCSPATGLPGTKVTLSGTNLVNPLLVLFNGRSAEFTADTATSITATVPEHATTGPVTVVTPIGIMTTLVPFTVPTPLQLSLIAGKQLQLSWSADALHLRLESSPSLESPDWQPVRTSPQVGPDHITWTCPLDGGCRYFRLGRP